MLRIRGNNKLQFYGFIILLFFLSLISFEILFMCKNECRGQKSLQFVAEKLTSHATNFLGSQMNMYQLLMRGEGIEFLRLLSSNGEGFGKIPFLETIECAGESLIIPLEETLLKDLQSFGYPYDFIPTAGDSDEEWIPQARTYGEYFGQLRVEIVDMGAGDGSKRKKHIQQSPHRLAVVVAFRVAESDTNIERCNHLRLFISYMAKFLESTPHRLFVFYLDDAFTRWNKGVLFNVAAKVIPSHYDYFVFHDADELPLNSTNAYKFHEYPIHRGRAVSRLNYENEKVTKTAMMAIFQISRRMYEKVNGFSNAYWGWGGEDDDMEREKNEPVCLLPPIEQVMSFSLPHRRDHSLQGEEFRNMFENREYLFANEDVKGRRIEGLDTVKYEIEKEQHSKSYSMYFVRFLNNKMETRSYYEVTKK